MRLSHEIFPTAIRKVVQKSIDGPGRLVLLVIHGLVPDKTKGEGSLDGFIKNVEEVNNKWFWAYDVDVIVEDITWKDLLDESEKWILESLTPQNEQGHLPQIHHTDNKEDIMPGLRQSIAFAMSDLVLWLSQCYGDQITKYVIDSIERVAFKHLSEAKNVRFSVVGHSLGSCIAFELTTGIKIRKMYHTSSNTFPLFRKNDGVPEVPVYEEKPLSIDINSLFLMGSPLPSLLGYSRPSLIPPLKDKHNIEPSSDFGSSESIVKEITPHLPIPDDLRVYNILYRQDPAAFRLSPIISGYDGASGVIACEANFGLRRLISDYVPRHLSLVKQIYLHTNKRGGGMVDQLPISECGKHAGFDLKKYIDKNYHLEDCLQDPWMMYVWCIANLRKEHKKYLREKYGRVKEKQKSTWKFWNPEISDNVEEYVEQNLVDLNRLPGKGQVLRKLTKEEVIMYTPNYRGSDIAMSHAKSHEAPTNVIDFFIQDDDTSHYLSTISAVTSHVSYWDDPDVAFFIIRHALGVAPRMSINDCLAVWDLAEDSYTSICGSKSDWIQTKRRARRKKEGSPEPLEIFAKMATGLFDTIGSKIFVSLPPQEQYSRSATMSPVSSPSKKVLLAQTSTLDPISELLEEGGPDAKKQWEISNNRHSAPETYMEQQFPPIHDLSYEEYSSQEFE